jgi:catechol 2,3-dioxygenase-like lactoylglutathione lyase family enzyme
MTVPELRGIHHLKLPVSDLHASLDFYERALGATRIPQADHFRADDHALYAFILAVPGLGAMLELRLHPERAQSHAGFDSVTISVADRAALTQWDRHLTEQSIPHSPLITAIQAWLIVVEDPDGNRLRLYTEETHGPELPPDEGNDWLQN